MLHGGTLDRSPGHFAGEISVRRRVAPRRALHPRLPDFGHRLDRRRVRSVGHSRYGVSGDDLVFVDSRQARNVFRYFGFAVFRVHVFEIVTLVNDDRTDFLHTLCAGQFLVAEIRSPERQFELPRRLVFDRDKVSLLLLDVHALQHHIEQRICHRCFGYDLQNRVLYFVGILPKHFGDTKPCKVHLVSYGVVFRDDQSAVCLQLLDASQDAVRKFIFHCGNRFRLRRRGGLRSVLIAILCHSYLK